MANPIFNAAAREAAEQKAIETRGQQSSTSSSDGNDESTSSSQAEDNEQEEMMADSTNSKSEAESHRAKESNNTSTTSSASVSHSASTDNSASDDNEDSASESARIEKLNQNDTVQQKSKPAPKKTATEAAQQTAIIAKADKAKHDYEDAHDYNPTPDIIEGTRTLRAFTKEFGQDAKQHQLDHSENVERLTGLLYRFIKYWEAALNRLWSSKNYDIYCLQVQMKALQDAGSGMKGVDVKGQLGIILQWIRTGVPSKIDEDFQRIDKIANDPQFIAWAKQNHQNEELGIPKAMETKYDEVEGAKKRRESAESAQANQTKSGK